MARRRRRSRGGITDVIAALRLNLTKALQMAADATFEENKDSYFKKAEYEGTPWKPYAEATIRWKQAAGYKKPYKLLNVTGNLMGNWQTMPLGYGNVLWGTNVPYAFVQNFGAELPAQNVTVKAHDVKEHYVPKRAKRRIHVKEHTRTSKTGKTYTVKAHTVKRHKVAAHTVSQHTVHFGKRIIPARPFIPSNRRVYAELCENIEGALLSLGIPCTCTLI